MSGRSLNERVWQTFDVLLEDSLIGVLRNPNFKANHGIKIIGAKGMGKSYLTDRREHRIVSYAYSPSLSRRVKLVALAAFRVTARMGRDTRIALFRRRQTERTIKAPPGHWMTSFSEFFFSKKTCELVLNLVVADMRYEYFDALSNGRTAKARWIIVRGHFSYVLAVGTTAVGKLFRALVGDWFGKLTNTPR
jgi:hypothetical protein